MSREEDHLGNHFQQQQQQHHERVVLHVADQDRWPSEVVATENVATSTRRDHHPPTRFRFYEPKPPTPIAEPKNPNRFTFYEAETHANTTSNTATIGNSPDTNNHTNHDNNNNNNNNNKKNAAMATRITLSTSSSPAPASAAATSTSSNAHSGTEDILKSLQETEEQRQSILSVDLNSNTRTLAEPATETTTSNGAPVTPSTLLRSPMNPPPQTSSNLVHNPYENAIKEALTLLQKHKPSQNHGLLDTNINANTAGSTSSNVQSPRQLEGYKETYEQQKQKAKQRQERMAQYASRLEEFKSQLSPTSAAATNPTASAGVPSTPSSQLMQSNSLEDILPKSHSIDVSELTSGTSVEEEVQKGVERVLLAILERATTTTIGSQETSANSYNPSHGNTVPSMDNILSQAMGELGLYSKSISGGALGSQTSGGDGTHKSQNTTSVVDQLLAEDEEDDHDTRPSWGMREEKKLPDHPEGWNRHEEQEAEDDNNDDQDDVDRLVEECLRSVEEKGDETEEDIIVSKNARATAPTGRVLGPLSHEEQGMLVSGVVLDDPSSIDRQGHAKLYHGESNSESPVSVEKKDKYAPSYLDDEESEGEDDDEEEEEEEGDETTMAQESESDEDMNEEEDDDIEASELMRTLCAHFLPFGVDSSMHQLVQAIPDWDDSNPNEAGYRIIRLSRSQLQRVELAFETMIHGLKRKSEQQLGNGEEKSDTKFARELLEAERLLDESEQLGKSGSGITSKAVPASAERVFDPSLDDGTEQGHPSFPGVKATGRGEMGDLEYFHLPIIFKSHVTGFEPTKDLVLEPGNVVAGQYLVESELGSAAFSTAYRCIDLSTEREDDQEEVCLKVIKNTKDFFDQSLDEIKILELLRQTGKTHENHIVEMKCFFYYREHLIIVTELLRQNLFEFGKFIMENNEEPYFTIPRLAYISRQALISLRFVHGLGLVHSDVKPENILLSSYSRAQIKLIDFGSSCYLTDRQSSYIQSRSYRAPEVVLGLPYDGKIDVWSLGCVIAEMYTGEVTFQNDSIVSMLSRIEAICGPFPRHMISQGRQSGRFFTKSGLLYEVVDDEQGKKTQLAPGPHDDGVDDDYTMQFDIFQPKNTRLSSRLGFEAELMDDFDIHTFKSKRTSPDKRHRQLFTHFVRQLLTIDPDARPTAEEALNHPWMQYAASLTEEEIKYPSS